MIRNLLFALMISGLALPVLAQQKESKHTTAPAVTITAFEKAFPGAANTKWGKEKKDYEANFSLQGKQMSAVYDNKGTLKETEEDIAVEALPAAAVNYIKQHYKGAAIKEAAKITKPDGSVNFEAEVNKKDLVFSAAGNFIKEEKD